MAMTDTQALYGLYLKSSGICTDTRKITKGCLFFCLRGANYDANLFAQQALDAGALAVVVDSELHQDRTSAEGYQVVPDSLEALQQLATHHRIALGLKVIAVCGSNGKTTTKELLSLVLSTKYDTFATPGNLNNHIGVPLSILKLNPSHEVAVLELGANGPDEIALLCEIAKPDAGFITNIGKDHLEGFGSVEGVARANAELFDYLIAHNGQLFCNTQELEVKVLVSQYGSAFTYPGPQDDYTCSLVSADSYIKIKDATGRTFGTQLVGAYNFGNVATALAIGHYYGVDPDDAAEAVTSYQPGNMRSQIVLGKSQYQNTILLDAYNANPSSMVLAIQNFAAMTWRGKPKALFVGDMFELGPEAEAEHAAIGILVSGLASIKVPVFVGSFMKSAHEQCPDSYHFETRAEAEAWLQDNPLQDHFVLLKGSRGMAMERLLPAL
jgi:UDP-N-acetylmuramoyl-tripeptide--D-alanyl-D-alanine ligase